MGEPASIEPALIDRMSIQDYLRFDDATPGKHEYHRGEVIAMARGTSSHSSITFNVAGEVRQKLRGTGCQGFSPDMRVGIPGYSSYFYPDLTVVCGEVVFDTRDRSKNTIINPKLVVEVLSPSTERVDRGRKFAEYLKLDSLVEYVLISQDEPRVESYYRQPDGAWGAFSFAIGLQASMLLRSLNIEIALAEIYTNVVFPPQEQTGGGEVIQPRPV